MGEREAERSARGSRSQMASLLLIVKNSAMGSWRVTVCVTERLTTRA